MKRAAALFASLAATATVAVEPVDFSFEVRDAVEPGSRVIARLRIPESPRGRLPAVVFLTSTPGFDGRSAFYAEALNAAGIATLEADVTAGRGMTASPRHQLPHVFQSLERLAGHPRIDGARIGVMGVSWGGTLAMLAGFEPLAAAHGVEGRRFTAHLPLYPVCWHHLAVLEDRPARWWKDMTSPMYARTTGHPVHVQVGDQDGYDGPGECGRFIAALPADARRDFALTTHPDATFAWDSRFDYRTWERGANRGAGDFVTVVADPAIAGRSRDLAVAFFRRHLAAE